MCVRIQAMNGVDINRFQFESDLTWMSFFQNADGQTYARYGGREDAGPETQLNQKSLARVMQQVLHLHEHGVARPFDKYEPDPKQNSTPEQIPGMKKMLANRKVKCIHCHDVKSAMLKQLRADGRLKKEMVFTYPSPKNLGIQLDPNDQTRIKAVVDDSPADTAKLVAGDRLQQMDGHAVLTFADATRVLELAPAKGKLRIRLERDGQQVETEIQLPNRWRVSEDPSWRESNHVVGPNGGFWAVKLNAAQRKSQNISAEALALKITSIWGNWARSAGLQHGDIVQGIDGLTTDMSIKQLQTYLQLNKNWRDTVSIIVRRKGNRIELSMKLPDEPKD